MRNIGAHNATNRSCCRRRLRPRNLIYHHAAAAAAGGNSNKSHTSYTRPRRRLRRCVRADSSTLASRRRKTSNTLAALFIKSITVGRRGNQSTIGATMPLTNERIAGGDREARCLRLTHIERAARLKLICRTYDIVVHRRLLAVSFTWDAEPAQHNSSSGT